MDDSQRQQPDRAPWKSTGGPTARKGLGRGLGALIPGADLAVEPGVIEIPIDRIKPSARQPRTGFEEEPMAELEASIREHGVLQPVLVRPAGEMPGTYELVAGERRWRAAVAAGLRSIPAVVRPLDDRGALEAALVENLQREDLNPVERARAYRSLLEDFGLTQEAVAKRVGRSQPAVANTIRLLSLPPEVLASLEAGRISEGHARALAGIQDPDQLLATWKWVETRGLTVRATEALASRAAISHGIRRRRKAAMRSEINIVEQSLTERFGTRVRIIPGASGGEIRVTFASPDDLERLLELLLPDGRGRA